MYKKRKAEGAFIRSQKHWLEQQNSSYFFKLEKYHEKMNTINELKIYDTISDDPKLISNYCSAFYRNVYTSEYSENEAQTYLNSSQNTPQLDDSERDLCDLPLSVTEVSNCIDLLKDNRQMVYRLNFINYFPSRWRPSYYKFLMEVNSRPICLLNNDYKILALIFAKRIQKVLSSVIDEAQSGFMPNRHTVSLTILD